jgi:hypothetical protein
MTIDFAILDLFGLVLVYSLIVFVSVDYAAVDIQYPCIIVVTNLFLKTLGNKYTLFCHRKWSDIVDWLRDAQKKQKTISMQHRRNETIATICD